MLKVRSSQRLHETQEVRRSGHAAKPRASSTVPYRRRYRPVPNNIALVTSRPVPRQNPRNRPPNRTYRDSLTWASYTGSAMLPLSRVNVVGAATAVTYSGGLRPWKVTLPTVQDEYGNNVQPVVEYLPQELLALGATVPLTSLYTDVKDPRGNWTRSELNRWGSAVRTWDALGTLVVSTYDAAGRVLTAEGKAGDSTRVYQTYDGAGRLVRVHRLRPDGSPLRLDSLVYDDPTDRVVRRIDALGNVTYLSYDGNGNLIQSITPGPDTTRTWYGAYGQVDSVQVPSSPGRMRYTYDVTWRNTADTYNQLGDVVGYVTYDGFGRRAEAGGAQPTRPAGLPGGSLGRVLPLRLGRRQSGTDRRQPVRRELQHPALQ